MRACVGIDLALTELIQNPSLHLTFIRQSPLSIPSSTEMTFRSGDHSAPFPTSPPHGVKGRGERGDDGPFSVLKNEST